VGIIKDETVLTIDEYRSKANLVYVSTVWKNGEVVNSPSPKDIETEDNANAGLKLLHSSFSSLF